MPALKVLARYWKIEIKVEAAFIPVLGLTSITFDADKSDADTTTFDSDGANEHIVASRGRTVSLEGQYLEDPVAKTRDPGQEAVEDLAEKVGPTSLAVFKRTSPAGTVKYFYASASVGGIGGGNDDPTGWSAELTVSGKLLEADPSAA